MSIIILIPSIVCLIALLRGGTQYAFFVIYLPVLMLFPEYYTWKVQHLPHINFVEATIVPIGLTLLATSYSKWRFSRSDLWMVLFVISAGTGDLRVGDPSTAIYNVFHVMAEGLFPYMAGKLLIEQFGMREKTTRRLIGLLCGASIISMFEYFVPINLFFRFWSHVFPDQWGGWSTQKRWGFGRIAGPYGQSELAGLIFLTGLVLAFWLSRKNSLSLRPSEGVNAPKTLRGVVPVLAITLFMTQARGPWVGSIIAFAVAFIGLAKKPARRTVLIFGLGLLIGIPAYVALKSYASGPRTDYGSEKETAQYRQQLLDNYIPLVQQGGLWGWGLNFPNLGGQSSIDNEYLFVAIEQGYVGLAAFVLLLLEAGIILMRRGFLVKSDRDRHFIFSLLGVLAGFAFVLATVFLGMQTFPLFFLLIGWSQAVGTNEAEDFVPDRVEEQQVFMVEPTRVYM